MPSKSVKNSVFRNNGDFTFDDKRKDWGLDEPSFSNGSAYGDLDNDGDLDLVVNNVNSKAFVFENKSKGINNFLSIRLKGFPKNINAIGSKVILYKSDGNNIMSEQFPSRGFQSSVPYRLHFGLGKEDDIDSVEIFWPNRRRSILKNVNSNQILEIDFNQIESKEVNPEPTFIVKNTDTNNLIDFTHNENHYIDFDIERLLPQMFSNEGPCISNYDLNNDGIQDFYVGGAKGQTSNIFMSKSSGYEKISTPFEIHKDSEDIQSIFFDADNDGDQDLYVASGGKAFSKLSRTLNDRFYRNDQGNLNYDSEALSFSNFFSTGAVAVGDINNDGYQDIIVGERFDVDTYGIPGSIKVLINRGDGTFESTYPSELKNIGMITDIAIKDLNSDNKKDIIVVGEWMQISFFINTNNKWELVSDEIGLKNTNGIWQSIESDDFNNDGIPDFVVGNMGQNGFYKPNMKFYLNDFDQNGKLETIYTYKINGNDYPIHDRDELIKQLPELKKKLLYYNDYSTQTIKDIFDKKLLSSSYIGYLDETKSLILLSKGPLSYEIQYMPDEIQYSSVHAINIEDINFDGKKDLILGGNQFLVKPQFGAYDASKGWIMYGSKNSNNLFDNLKPLNIYGQIRDFSIVPNLKSSDSLILLVGISNSKIITKNVK